MKKESFFGAYVKALRLAGVKQVILTYDENEMESVVCIYDLDSEQEIVDFLELCLSEYERQFKEIRVEV